MLTVSEPTGRLLLVSPILRRVADILRKRARAEERRLLDLPAGEDWSRADTGRVGGISRQPTRLHLDTMPSIVRGQCALARNRPGTREVADGDGYQPPVAPGIRMPCQFGRSDDIVTQCQLDHTGDRLLLLSPPGEEGENT